MLSNIQATVKAQATAAGTRPGGSAAAASYARALEAQAAQFGGAAAAAIRHDAVTPLQPKMRSRLFRKPTTLMSFFSRRAAPAAAGVRADAPAPGAAARKGQGVKRTSGGAVAGRSCKQTCKHACKGTHGAAARADDVVDLSADTPVKVAKVCAGEAAEAAVAALACKEEPDEGPACLPPLAAGASGGAAEAVKREAGTVAHAAGEAGGWVRAGAGAAVGAVEGGHAGRVAGGMDADGLGCTAAGAEAAASAGGRDGAAVGVLAKPVAHRQTHARRLSALASSVTESMEARRGEERGGAAALAGHAVVPSVPRAAAPVQPLAEKHENGAAVARGGTAAQAAVKDAKSRDGDVTAGGVTAGAGPLRPEKGGADAGAAERVLALGFRRTEVDIALKICRGNADRAIEYLLTR